MCAGDHAAAGLRLAIVGVGPKGLFALERLLDAAQRAGPRAPLDVDLFEPHPAPGAGPVYDPAQPDYLRMNFAAEHLDMWCDESGAVSASERQSFVDWRHETSGEQEAERYPPRALVGRYLADGLRRMREAAPSHVTITLRPTAVRGLERRGSSWMVAAADGVARPGYEEVLVATGHATGRHDWPSTTWRHAAPLISAVFPITRLAPDQIAPGASVAVRGFALTFLDAALALTEGRGGVFAPDHHRFRLRYAPSSRDAAVILPFSRTGRPMLAKPDPSLAAGLPGLGAIARDAQARILALPEGFAVRDGLLSILAAAAEASLFAADQPASALMRRQAPYLAARQWLTAACHGVAPPTSLTPAQEIERSLQVGTGLVAPDLPWALGHTWRAIYPALVTRLGHGGLGVHQWPVFRALAAQMERVAFGPPPLNAAKLLALIEARRVDLGQVRAPQIQTRGHTTVIFGPNGERGVDVVVNAVLPEPGARRSDSGLLERLVEGGHARIIAGGRGLQVDTAAGCIGCDGRLTPGLSAIGRPTEDSVIGNDTLSRSLHPQAAAWARRVIDAAARAPTPDPVGLQAA